MDEVKRYIVRDYLKRGIVPTDVAKITNTDLDDVLLVDRSMIEEKLAARDRRISYLVERLVREGITEAETIAGARQTIYSWIRKNKLRLRRKSMSRYFVVNEKEVKEIIEAFKKGGKGVWYYH